MDSPKKSHQNPHNHHYSPPPVGVGVGVPMPMEQPSPSLGPWSTGLFDCFDDYNSCCLTLWCPCVTVGRVSEIVDEGAVSCGLSGLLYTLLIAVCGASCCYTSWIRSKLRWRHLLEAEPCNDCLIHCFCQGCALCQEYRELVNRGYDMSLGWEGNVERHRQMMMMATMHQPAVQWGMVR